MLLRSASFVLVIIALYGLGLYGFWQLLSERTFHWSVIAFPFALLGIAVVPFLKKAAKPVARLDLVGEDRSE